MNDRTILHCDLNNFYASVETLGRPDLQKRPVAVCGDPEKRHGIILAKNEPAKKFGIKTGETLLTARAKCADLILLPAHHGLYMRYSEAMRDLYRRYTDRIESFGIDECWLDVTDSAGLFGNGVTIANELRALAKCELGLTISAGVSFNKFFAKMGSDYKKPDATTCVSRENYKELLWPLPVEDMLFVGAATARRLRLFGIGTIGDLAHASDKTLARYFGRPGLHLLAQANGFDPTPVAPDDYRRPPESVGNSVTCPYDLETEEQIRTVLFMLCDSVATRLRRHGMKCRAVSLYLRFPDLSGRVFRKQLENGTELSTALYSAVLSLLRQHRHGDEALRGLGVRAEKLENSRSFQLSFLDRSFEIARKEQLERAVDGIRGRFGREILGSALYLLHSELTEDHPLGHRVRPGNFDDTKGFPNEVPGDL